MSESELDIGKRTSHREKLVIVSVVIFALFLIVLNLKFETTLIDNMQQKITGLAAYDKGQKISIHIDKTYVDDSIEPLFVSGEISSIKVNGRYIGQFKLWINISGKIFLLAESETVENLITGMDVLDIPVEEPVLVETNVSEEVMEEPILTESVESPIVEEIVEILDEVNESIYVNISEEVLNSSEEDILEDILVDTTNVEVNDTVLVEEILEDISNTSTDILIDVPLIEYSELKNECEETCSININVTSLTLIIELSDNSTLIIDSIQFTNRTKAIISKKMLHNVTTFSGETTNFELLEDPTNVLELVLDKPSHGTIKWNKGKYNVLDADFDKHVDIGERYVYVNSEALDSSINTEAEITLENIPYADPIIYRDNVYCSDCEILSYEQGVLTFIVPGFSNYTVGSSANLSVWDDTDSVERYVNESVKFFANYSNITNGLAINGSGMYCEFIENSSGSWSSPVNMTFNSSSKLYEYNKSFDSTGNYSFNISCYNDIGFDNLSVIDDFELLLSVCSELSTANTLHVLHNNVVSNGTCFTITAANVTLDCNGYWIIYSTEGGANTYGVYSSQFNTTIKNCNILDGNWTSSETTRYGLYMYDIANSTAYNNFVNTSNSYALFLNYQSNYNTITANRLFSNSTSAMRFDTGYRNIFVNNNVTSINGDDGFYCSGSYTTLISNFIIGHGGLAFFGVNSTLINNTGVATASFAHGIYALGSGNNLTGNTGIGNGTSQSGGIVLHGATGYILDSNMGISNASMGIQLYQNSNNNVLRNNFGQSLGSGAGIYMSSSSNNNTLINNTGISSNQAIGIDESNNNTFISNNATGGTGYYLTGANYTHVYDCIEVSGSTYSIRVISNSIGNEFTNCSYDASKESVTAGSDVSRLWYFDANVTNSTGSVLQNANVTIYNFTQDTVYTALTNSTGDIGRAELTEYVNNGGTIIYATPHTINVTKIGYYINSTNHNITESQNVFTTISLQAVTDTMSIITSMVSFNAITPIESSSKIISFNFTVDDAQGNNTINISSAIVRVNNSGIVRQSQVSSCIGIPINITAQNVSCNVSLQYYDPSGVWFINVSIENTMGEYIYNTSTTFTYNTLYAISLNTNLLDFGTLSAGDVNKTASMLLLNNTGNFNYTLVQLKAYDLVNSTYVLSASNFRINITNVSVGDILGNNTFINITGATLPISTDVSIGNQSMYIYVDIPLGTAAKKFTSISDWVLSLS